MRGEDGGAVDTNEAGGGAEEDDHEMMLSMLVLEEELRIREDLAEGNLASDSERLRIGRSIVKGILSKVPLALNGDLKIGPVRTAILSGVIDLRCVFSWIDAAVGSDVGGGSGVALVGRRDNNKATTRPLLLVEAFRLYRTDQV